MRICLIKNIWLIFIIPLRLILLSITIIPISAQSTDPDYTFFPGNNNYENQTYVQGTSGQAQTTEYVLEAIVNALPGSLTTIIAKNGSLASFLWNIGGTGMSQTSSLTVSNPTSPPTTNNELTIYYALITFDYTGVKEWYCSIIILGDCLSGWCWNDLGSVLVPTTLPAASPQWDITLTPSGGNPTFYQPNYTHGYQNKFPVAQITSYIEYTYNITTYQPTDNSLDAQGSVTTRSDSVQLKKGYEFSIGFSVSFVGVGVSKTIPLSMINGQSSSSYATYQFQGDQYTDTDWLYGSEYPVADCFQVHPSSPPTNTLL